MGTDSVLRTLLVEDNQEFRVHFKQFLLYRYPFMRIEEAGSAVEALAKMKERLPDLIFMDIRLPGPNGLHLTSRIKAEFPEIKVVILTAYDEEVYRAAAREAGANHFLDKTAVTSQEFAAIIDSMAAEIGIPMPPSPCMNSHPPTTASPTSD